MLTENDVLLTLNNDSWFKPSMSDFKKTIIDTNGNQIKVAESYYHTSTDGSQIIIRVSNHGTALTTWVKRRSDPSESLQNLSVVFSNEPVTSNLITEPIKFYDKNGKVIEKELYFVVEQYVYRMENLSKKDFIKFINKLKALGTDQVFRDPFKKKASKKATRNVLTPQNVYGQNVPQTNNPIHPRQTAVLKNKDKEIDAKGDVIADSKKRLIDKIISETIERYLSENLVEIKKGTQF